MATFQLLPEFRQATSALVSVPGGRVIDVVALADRAGKVTTDDERTEAALRGYFGVEEVAPDKKRAARKED